MSVIPPASPAEPVSIFIADHGIHSSILIPRGESTTAQYSFSQWGWAALDRDAWYHSVPAIAGAGYGALGRREYACEAEPEVLIAELERARIFPSVKALHEIRVARSESERLLGRLDARWEARAETRVDNPKRGFAFVREEQRYSAANNCNTAVAEWLEQLGCRVSGPGLSADFSVRTSAPAERPMEAPTASPVTPEPRPVRPPAPTNPTPA